jgi:ribosome-binding factor A
MKRGESRSRSQRQLRVGEVIRHALSQLLERGEAHDPGLHGVSITVTEVRISPDLRNATAFVMPLGGVEADGVLESLSRAAPFFRRRMAQSVQLRRLPILSFELDGSFDNAQHIDTLLSTPAVSADVDTPRDIDGPGGDDGP